MKVMTILGTRPEIIRLSRVMELLDTLCEHVIVHTGQNWDYALNQVFFDDLGLRRPDHFLEVPTSSLGAVLGGVLARSEEVLLEERPDAVLVLGDTNSCLSVIMAKRLGIPVFHMEAGNRCFDTNVPEETNRRIVDHVADVNLVYTDHARRNLLSEGLPARQIYLTGSPLAEVLTHYRPQIDASQCHAQLGLERGAYYLASVHREENVDEPVRLRSIVDALGALHARTSLPVLVSTHPRTRDRLDRDSIRTPEGVRFAEPFGFHDYNSLQLHARCVLSDSGSISEEAAILGFPAITLRDSIERPEAIDAGTISVVGVGSDAILSGVAVAESVQISGLKPPADYAEPSTSVRVARVILGIAPLVKSWTGRRSRSG